MFNSRLDIVGERNNKVEDKLEDSIQIEDIGIENIEKMVRDIWNIVKMYNWSFKRYIFFF